MEGHVGGQDGTNDQLPDLLHCTQALLSIVGEDSHSPLYLAQTEVQKANSFPLGLEPGSAMSQLGSLAVETTGL